MGTKTIDALPGRVLVSDMESGIRSVGNILITNDNGKTEGIRPRWAKVYSVGEGVNTVSVGEWILLEHGRWTHAITLEGDTYEENKNIWMVDWPKGAIAAADKPTTIFAKDTIVHSTSLTR